MAAPRHTRTSLKMRLLIASIFYWGQQISQAEFLFCPFFGVGLSPAKHYIVKGRQNDKILHSVLYIVE